MKPINNIVYLVYLQNKIYCFKKISRKPIPLHPGSGSSLGDVKMWPAFPFHHAAVYHWVLVSEPGFCKVWAHFPGNLFVYQKWNPGTT